LHPFSFDQLCSQWPLLCGYSSLRPHTGVHARCDCRIPLGFLLCKPNRSRNLMHPNNHHATCQPRAINQNMRVHCPLSHRLPCNVQSFPRTHALPVQRPHRTPPTRLQLAANRQLRSIHTTSSVLVRTISAPSVGVPVACDCPACFIEMLRSSNAGHLAKCRQRGTSTSACTSPRHVTTERT
jgi:hypothetical protein